MVNMMWDNFFHRKFFFGIKIFFCLIFSCHGNAAEDLHVNPLQYSTPSGWQSICLDRYLIDLPSTVDMAAAPAKYGSAYQFEGTPFGADGPAYGGNKIIETVPTEVNSYKKIYFGAKSRLISSESYSNSIKRVESDFLKWKKIIEKNGGEVAVAIKEGKEIADEKILDLRYRQKVSGEQLLVDPNSFAIRHADEFSIAYLDLSDKRIRLVEGKIARDSVPSPTVAGDKFIEFKNNYKPRLPTDIPNKPGFCTNFGFLSENGVSENKTTTETLFRSKKYPNLIFKLFIEPAVARPVQNIQKLPHMDAENAKLDLIGVKKSHGPTAVQILGAPGRVFAQEYGNNCSATSCRPADQNYDFEAETYGEPGRLDRPHLILNMKAATSDDYRLKLPVQANEPSYNKPTKPSLSGTVPPPFVEGKEIFEQVLKSLRMRPGAITISSPK